MGGSAKRVGLTGLCAVRCERARPALSMCDRLVEMEGWPPPALSPRLLTGGPCLMARIGMVSIFQEQRLGCRNARNLKKEKQERNRFLAA